MLTITNVDYLHWTRLGVCSGALMIRLGHRSSQRGLQSLPRYRGMDGTILVGQPNSKASHYPVLKLQHISRKAACTVEDDYSTLAGNCRAYI